MLGRARLQLASGYRTGISEMMNRPATCCSVVPDQKGEEMERAFEILLAVAWWAVVFTFIMDAMK